MKKFTKVLIALLLTLAIVAGGIVGVLYFVFDINVFDQSGWDVSDTGSVRYLDYYGKPLVSWQLVDGQWYYFDPESDGAMYTGWLSLDGSRYYMEASGIRASGWRNLSDGQYYLSPSGGAAVTGWLTLDDARYYFNDLGQMCTGWQEIDSERFHFSENGTVDTGWLSLEGNRYYLGDDGKMFTLWYENEDGKRYFDPDTGAMARGWYEVDDYRRYFSEDGLLCTGWTDTPDGTFYLNDLGCPTTGWTEIDDDTYYFSTDTGEMTTGWLTLDDVRYYFREDGTMAIGKVVIDGTASYFASNGAYVVMVNRWNPVPEDYETNLVSYGEWRVDAQVLEPLKQMLADCPYSYTITSAYRSEATQKSIWNTRLQRYKNQGYSTSEAETLVGQSVAIPGTSEHHLGLAVDISSGEAGYAWLAEHCAEYGFILRYQEGFLDITGTIHEPWHFRYLGTELAKEVADTGLCFEQYFDMLTLSQGSDAGTASDPDKYTNTYTQYLNVA